MMQRNDSTSMKYKSENDIVPGSHFVCVQARRVVLLRERLPGAASRFSCCKREQMIFGVGDDGPRTGKPLEFGCRSQ